MGNCLAKRGAAARGRLAGGLTLLLCALTLGHPAAAGSTERDAAADSHLSVAGLRAALLGERMTHLGQVREGPAASAFARGYVAAVSEVAAAEGDWCGDGRVLPHEMVAQVFDRLASLPEAAQAGPALPATRRALGEIFPCAD